MLPEDMARFYFQKAEAERSNLSNYRANSTTGLLFVVLALVFTGDFWEILFGPWGLYVLLILLMFISFAVWYFASRFNVGYKEYKAEYIKFCSLPYIRKYTSDIDAAAIMGEDIDKITREIRNDTDFDINDIRSAVKLYFTECAVTQDSAE